MYRIVLSQEEAPSKQDEQVAAAGQHGDQPHADPEQERAQQVLFAADTVSLWLAHRRLLGVRTEVELVEVAAKVRIEILKVRIEILKVSIKTLKVRVEILKVRIGTLKVRVEILKVRIEILKVRIGTLKVRIEIMMVSIETLKVKMETLKVKDGDTEGKDLDTDDDNADNHDGTVDKETDKDYDGVRGDYLLLRQNNNNMKNTISYNHINPNQIYILTDF